VERRAVALAADLGLPVAGIDLMIDEDGDVYCLEVNPSPAFSYYEQNTGQPIAMAIARYLSGWKETRA
ncbi:MAG: ATP-grasp domain-containing protein, partial [Acidimicrobiia bacterium]